jgi:hypothetical protein
MAPFNSPLKKLKVLDVFENTIKSKGTVIGKINCSKLNGGCLNKVKGTIL